MIRIGTAGWSLPSHVQRASSHLHHYSRTLCCVEVNSCFYRTHRAATWARWAVETPADFRFSLKAPKTITHEYKLHDTQPLLSNFLHQIQPLKEKAGPILFQFPPSFKFDLALVEDFLSLFRMLHEGEAAFEPRHETWFTTQANELLKSYQIARVMADPAAGASAAGEPGGDENLFYCRLHGQPRIYYSSYDENFLTALAAKVRDHRNAWVIFDNTALSNAYRNAILFRAMLRNLSAIRQ
jgi:uncharacterized protein YecE (DUF72 family)